MPTWYRSVTRSTVRVGHAVDDGGDGQDESGILPLLDLDPVGVGDAEPLLRDLGDLVTVALDLVLVVDDVALHLEVLTVLDLDVEPLPQRRDQRLLHGCDRATAAVLDLHRVADAKLLLLDLEQLTAARVLEDHRVPDTERLAVDLERPFALVVLDPVVITDRHQLLPHAERRDAVPFVSSSLTPVAQSHELLLVIRASTQPARPVHRPHPPWVRSRAAIRRGSRAGGAGDGPFTIG